MSTHGRFKLKPVIRRSVYVIKNDIGMCKVGIAVDPKVRLAELQTGSPHPLNLAYAIIHSDASGVEQRAHKILGRYHVHGEWFKCDLRTAEAAVNRAAQIINVDVKGTILRIIVAWIFGLLVLLALWAVAAMILTKYFP